jgi:hypothetical protein
MNSLPEALVQFRADLEAAIGREQAARSRRRRQRLVVLAAAAIVVLGTASAFATVRDLFFVEAVAKGRISRTVEGVRFSLSIPRAGWENGPHERINGEIRTRSLYISKSTVGPQSAEAVIFWTGLRDRREAAPCTKLLGSAIGGSTADLAAAVARAPGTKIVKAPTRVSVGGRSAMHVVLRVRKDAGCDPGFFFTWRWQTLGAFWHGTDVGDTIRVWIVDVNGTRLFIEAETHKQAGRGLEQQIAEIVGSIRFE